MKREENVVWGGGLSDMKCASWFSRKQQGNQKSVGVYMNFKLLEDRTPFLGDRNDERQKDSKWQDIKERKGADRERESLYLPLI